MPLIKDGAEIPNTWTFFEDGEVIPEGVDAVVSFSRLLDGEGLCQNRKGRIGVRVRGENHVERLVSLLPRLSLIEVEFPTFRDGRGYSSARLLRERFKYQGELRAVGDVLHDQLFAMVRCGFDAFLTPKAGAAEFAEAMKRYSIVYQPAADGRTPIGRVRAKAEH